MIINISSIYRGIYMPVKMRRPVFLELSLCIFMGTGKRQFYTTYLNQNFCIWFHMIHRPICDRFESFEYLANFMETLSSS